MKRSIIFVLVLAGLTYSKRYYDPEIGMWISVDPMEQHFSPYTYGGNNPVNRIDPDGGADYGTQDKMVEAAIASQTTWQPSATQTYCNKGTQQIVNAGLNNPIKGTATEILTSLRNTDFATSITAEQAIAYAQQGLTPIAAVPGHVSVVSPLSEKPAGNDSKGNPFSWHKLPFILNIGRQNEEIGVNYSFGKNAKVEYFILNEDVTSLQNRQK
jgi:uncharacterized protein RhaS with RHS repeats